MGGEFLNLLVLKINIKDLILVFTVVHFSTTLLYVFLLCTCVLIPACFLHVSTVTYLTLYKRMMHASLYESFAFLHSCVDAFVKVCIMLCLLCLSCFALCCFYLFVYSPCMKHVFLSFIIFLYFNFDVKFT